MNKIEGNSKVTKGDASIADAPAHFHVMTKPIGPICNLDCKYCFYLEKEKLYPSGERWKMSDEVLESYISQYIAAQAAPEVNFAWQGGEPTLLGLDYFRKVVEFQQKHSGGKKIFNALQTNGTLLDDAWCAWLAEQGFLIGLSIDGPRALHDSYRVDKAGKPTFDAVMRGIGYLKKHGTQFNTLTVVNRLNGAEPLKVYRFLKEIGSGFMQFIPLVERRGGEPLADGAPPLAEPPLSGAENSPVTDWSVGAAQYGSFLVSIFDEWVRRDVGSRFVQIFDVALGIWTGRGSSLCVFSERCGNAMALEHNGDLYSCDHYVYPRYKLGNLMDAPLQAMAGSAQQRQFGNDKADTLPAYCRRCEVRFACNGECPKHRFTLTPDGEAGLNYLCPSYKLFFNHIDPYMRTMGELLAKGRPPAEIMGLLAQQQPAGAPGRNDPCPCGSGRKYKQCCLKLAGSGL